MKIRITIENVDTGETRGALLGDYATPDDVGDLAREMVVALRGEHPSTWCPKCKEFMSGGWGPRTTSMFHEKAWGHSV